METTVLILIGDFEKLDARKKIVKKVQKTCKVLQFRRLDEQGKAQYINDQIKKRGLHVDQDALNMLQKRLPLDIRIMQMEFDKLELYGGTITCELVSNLVSRPLEEDVFQLVDAVVKKNVKSAFHIWQDLCILNKDAIYLIALLSSQFRFLFEVKVLSQKGMLKADIADYLKAHPYRVQLALSSVYNLSTQYLMHILEKLATLDQNLKAGRIDKKLGFEMFLLELQGELK